MTGWRPGNNVNQLAGKKACGGPHVKMRAQAGRVRDQLIEHVLMQCDLDAGQTRPSVCEASRNLPARAPAVIALYLQEKPKMKACLAQDSSWPGPTHVTCCFPTTERVEGSLFLLCNPVHLRRMVFYRWRNYPCSSEPRCTWSRGKLHFQVCFLDESKFLSLYSS